MFALSVERVWNIAWYMINQGTLDKGPTISYPASGCCHGNNNCWAVGNAGEIDFLEIPWTMNAGATDNYQGLYTTQWNQVDRSFVGDMGATGHADGGWFNNQVTSNNYFLQTDPYMFVAVVDNVGTFIYRISSSQSNRIWPGISRKSAACTLDTIGPPYEQ